MRSRWKSELKLDLNKPSLAPILRLISRIQHPLLGHSMAQQYFIIMLMSATDVRSTTVISSHLEIRDARVATKVCGICVRYGAGEACRVERIALRSKRAEL
jgi:hypothetical protein